MYELVNTSLPNGLIPGTHGFATAALTKGTPDTLRMRFESFCAYKHRTGAHDATYFKENPINWFHVVLPQGEHVLGRVAPEKFDYTGRTNRLAHLLVFSQGEMPGVGGAYVLQKEMNRFATSWSGEARWLDPDKLTLGRLRLEMPPKHADAPAWRAMFGESNGLNLAKGFARQLAKSMSSGGRTIYFKTSTMHDVDGTKLLALFADLVDLLPIADRQKVTFSTYPVALPQGTTCHLRGVYDRDRIFDAATATQPWVDCEKGIVHNASLLPPEENKQTASAEKATDTSLVSNQVRRSSGGVTVVRSPTYNQLLRKKDGSKSLFIGIIVFTVIVVLMAVAFGFYLLCENEPLRSTRGTSEMSKNSGRVLQVSNTNKIESATQSEIDKVVQPQGHGATEKANEGGETKRKEDARQLIRAQTAKEHSKMVEYAKQQECEQRKREKKEERDREIAFTKAKKIEVLEDGRLILSKFQGREEKMTNGSICVYWYDKHGVLTNALAEVACHKTGSTPSWLLRPRPEEMARNAFSNFLIWLDVHEKVAYWDWAPLKYNKKLEKWFAKTDNINLVELCFGKDPNVIRAFEDAVPKPWKFEIEVEMATLKTNITIDVNTTVDLKLSRSVVVEKLRETKSAENTPNELSILEKQKKAIEDEENEIIEKAKRFDQVREELKSATKTGKDKGATLNTEEKNAKKREQTDLKTEIVSWFKDKLDYGFNEDPTQERVQRTISQRLSVINSKIKNNPKATEPKVCLKPENGKYRVIKVIGSTK